MLRTIRRGDRFDDRYHVYTGGCLVKALYAIVKGPCSLTPNHRDRSGSWLSVLYAVGFLGGEGNHGVLVKRLLWRQIAFSFPETGSQGYPLFLYGPSFPRPVVKKGDIEHASFFWACLSCFDARVHGMLKRCSSLFHVGPMRKPKAKGA